MPGSPHATFARLRRLVRLGFTLLFLIGATSLPLLRAAQIIDTPWTIALAPFTLAGIFFLTLTMGMLLRPQLDWMRSLIGAARDNTPAITPVPDRLEAPLGAAAAGEKILVEYPEILAALCHGFRMFRLQPLVLGRSVSDPWGVYAAALLASSFEFEQVKQLARKHTTLAWYKKRLVEHRLMHR
jgi:hypothetical protein